MKSTRILLKQLEAEQKQLEEAEEDTLSLSSYWSEASSFYSEYYSDDEYSDDDYSDDSMTILTVLTGGFFDQEQGK
eukprot:scaffold1836_cov94-Skeletonema_marinoi.AAC.1